MAVSIYALWNSGHITNYSNQFVRTSRKSHLIRQLFGNLFSGLPGWIVILCFMQKKKENNIFNFVLACLILTFSDYCIHYPDFSWLFGNRLLMLTSGFLNPNFSWRYKSCIKWDVKFICLQLFECAQLFTLFMDVGKYFFYPSTWWD